MEIQAGICKFDDPPDEGSGVSAKFGAPGGLATATGPEHKQKIQTIACPQIWMLCVASPAAWQRAFFSWAEGKV